MRVLNHGPMKSFTCQKPRQTAKNIFAGSLRCSDCGTNLNYKYTHGDPNNNYFSGGNQRTKKAL